MKVVINNCWGGFCVSKEAQDYCNESSPSRTNQKLIEFIELFGSEKASCAYSLLKIVEIPDNVYYEIVDYDGMEYILYSESEIKTVY